MNRNLRELFTVVVALFVLLGISTTILMAFKVNELNADPRNTRALYHEYGVPRGAILASNGTVLAQSDPVSDSFQYRRRYPSGTVYAPVTGYYSVTSRADRGIEASRNDLLSGQSDSMWWDRFKSLFTGASNRGASIETSINPTLQRTAYSELGDHEGGIVVMEPQTGRILAMASTPSYDPTELATHNTGKASSNYKRLATSPSNPMLNRTIDEHYPPGSTFKLVVAATALDSGIYKEDTRIKAGSSYTLPGTATRLGNTTSAAAGVNGELTLKDALAYSSNTAFARLGVTLGNKAIAQKAQLLGFGSSVTIDGSADTGVPMKAAASVFPNTTSDDRLALASIGQGDTVETPLQNAMVASAIANEGTLMQPTIVDRTRASDLSVLSQTSPSVFSTTFSSQTAKSLTDMMKAVVTKDAPSLQLPQGVAAKTGTAQIGNGSKVDAWVTGFAPADNPKVAVAVAVHDVSGFGVDIAGPMMRRIMQEALQ